MIDNKFPTKPELRPISITIIDFLGVFLPGTVWLILFATLYHLHLNLDSCEPFKTPVWEVHNLLKNFSGTSALLLLLFSLLVGYAIKPLTTGLAEFFYGITPFAFNNLKKNIESNKFCFRDWELKASLADYSLPFQKDHEKHNYYKYIIAKLDHLIDFQIGPTHKKLKREKNNGNQIKLFPKTSSQPFSMCKRIIKELSPSLWEEAERREAEVRMLGAFFLSAIFSLFTSLYAIYLYWNCEKDSFSKLTLWFFGSLIFVVILGYSFGKQKRQEVDYVYMNFLIASHQLAPMTNLIITKNITIDDKSD